MTSLALSFRDAPLGAGPESILPIVVMDSGLALCAPRNDVDIIFIAALNLAASGPTNHGASR